jgi:hypothetical protein
VRLQRGDGRFVQRDHAPRAGLGFRLARSERFLVNQVDPLPPDLAQFLIPETRVQTNARAACIRGVRNFRASSSIRAFSSALYGRPGEGGTGNSI